MNKDHVAGKIDRAVGKVKPNVGESAGSDSRCETEEMYGSDQVPDLKLITNEPRLAEQKQQLQRERNGALL